MSAPQGFFSEGDGGTVAPSPQVDGYTAGSQPSQEGQGAQPQGQSPSEQGSGYNPAWQELLDNLPKQLHPVVTPHLQKMDSNYGKLAENYAPFKKTFVDQNISVEDLDRAYKFAQMVDQNPQEVYRRLGEVIGVSPQQAQQMVEDEQEGIEDQQYGDEPDLSQNPLFQQLQQQNEWLMQQFQAQQQTQMTQTYEQQIDAEVKQLQRADPNFDVPDVLQRVLAQMQRGEQPSIQKAYQDQKAYDQRILAQPRNGDSAPRVMPTNGGYPPGAEAPRPKTMDEKVDRVKQMLQAAQGT